MAVKVLDKTKNMILTAPLPLTTLSISEYALCIVYFDFCLYANCAKWKVFACDHKDESFFKLQLFTHESVNPANTSNDVCLHAWNQQSDISLIRCSFTGLRDGDTKLLARNMRKLANFLVLSNSECWRLVSYWSSFEQPHFKKHSISPCALLTKQ